MQLSTVTDDIYKILDGKSLIDSNVLKKYGDEFAEILASRLSEKKNKEPSLRMSTLGKPFRMLWYEMHEYVGEVLEGKTLLKFMYGSLLESLVLVLAEASGHKVERFQEEVKIDGILGHIDAVIDGVLIDVKSCSPYSFKKFKDGSLLEKGNDPFFYQTQLASYAKCIKLPAAWIAINKVDGEICVLDLPQELIDEYDVRKRIETVRQAISQTTPPERCYDDEPDGLSGNRKLGVSCSYCGFKSECWKDSNEGKGLLVYAYSGGPRFLTTVKKEPKVFLISNNKKENN